VFKLPSTAAVHGSTFPMQPVSASVPTTLAVPAQALPSAMAQAFQHDEMHTLRRVLEAFTSRRLSIPLPAGLIGQQALSWYRRFALAFAAEESTRPAHQSFQPDYTHRYVIPPDAQVPPGASLEITCCHPQLLARCGGVVIVNTF
jgi:hypothetical protein